jgi:hypothetical protein
MIAVQFLANERGARVRVESGRWERERASAEFRYSPDCEEAEGPRTAFIDLEEKHGGREEEHQDPPYEKGDRRDGMTLAAAQSDWWRERVSA